ncbi:MAG: bifunctional [glutamine synthetase] adenylyltransferase/[glutamine synthetase]-adenylyl-L-tyrosine phosphorylase [Alphaproteobacteria bacterium]|nr:bifunctional [glutamine synthetase] adenylyltransferase/[glutamine synthetase]-adenylyl-L-tyrosine phosphorylase [Alphaproteobacteria bacterium]
MLVNVDSLPRAADPDAVERGLDRWRDAAAALEDRAARRFGKAFADDPAGRRLLEAVFGNSPFLGRCMLAEIPLVHSLSQSSPDKIFSAIISLLLSDVRTSNDDANLMQALRRAKRRTALLVGLADIGGIWTLEQVTRALTDFAEAALSCALGHLLRDASAAGAFALSDPNEPEAGSGFAVLGMGKLGGRELNYSSDIDLIVLYEPERFEGCDRFELQRTLDQLVRKLVTILQERTADGYVFRTDLRLRPDPGATPPAMSMRAAETYYESLGQNWERAALIKARPVAGDREAGASFLRSLTPFIWRKNLDFAAIEDIHSIKRQIAAHRGGNRIAVAGHNVKLGRGGIREIEFFAQTQQLIYGGRDRRLRTAATCDSLRALVEADRLDQATADELIQSYHFLRRLEHRLQMVEDQQVHAIPKDKAGIEAVSVFLGYDSPEAFSEDLLRHLHRVEDHYGALFEEAPSLSGPGNLVFTGGEHDPDTLETISKMGFADSERVSTIVRQWHHGRHRATSTARAREILTELVPSLLAALAKTTDPDTALIKFNEFVAGLPAGVQLFSLFHANPQLLDVVAEVMGSAPYLAERLARNASLLDVMLDGDSMSGPPSQDELKRTLDEALTEANDYEDVLEITRRWTNDRKFQMGMQILLDTTDGDAAGGALSDIADTALSATQTAAEDHFSERHGQIAGGGLCVIAFGKHGGRELMPGSDLDSVFVFDCPEGSGGSDGAKPLTPGHYYARLGQALVSAVTSPTGRHGKLYEMDLRLRPSGSNGPLVPSLEGFVSYQIENAWTWEHMALTRARPVTGPPALRALVQDQITRILTRARDPERLVYEVARMRARMAKHHQAKSIWDIKHWRGGLVDIEFLAQYLMLRHAPDNPAILDTNTTEALGKLGGAGCLDPALAQQLAETMRLWRRVHSILRLTFGSRPFREEQLPDGLRRLLVRAGRAEDFRDLKATLADSARFVHETFVELIEAPASAVKVEEPSEQDRREILP